jgi:glucose-1-phosphate thymidylyltransferase
MIYYPLTTLMLTGIRDILIISTPRDLPQYENLLGDGMAFGLSLSYKVQEHPRGLPEAFIIGEEHIDGESVALILGDNLFHGKGISGMLKQASRDTEGNGNANLFGVSVSDPSRFGVADLSDDGKIISIEEKPTNPQSDVAVTGLYMYGADVVSMAKSLEPSLRGEIEITDLNMSYVEDRRANMNLLGRGVTWLDTGTPESLHSASAYIRAVQINTGIRVACVEEVAWRMGFIGKAELRALAEKYPTGNDYGDYIKSLI